MHGMHGMHGEDRIEDCWLTRLDGVSYFNRNHFHSVNSVYSVVKISSFQISVFRKRNALRMTETEEKLIAAPAIMGLRRIPKNG
jgi:hypothetical protein